MLYIKDIKGMKKHTFIIVISIMHLPRFKISEVTLILVDGLWYSILATSEYQ